MNPLQASFEQANAIWSQVLNRGALVIPMAKDPANNPVPNWGGLHIVRGEDALDRHIKLGVPEREGGPLQSTILALSRPDWAAAPDGTVASAK